MKCAACQTENRDDAGACRKCGATFGASAVWMPDWKWHARVIGVVYVVLIGVYVAISSFLKKVPEPYRMREVPPEVTPWIKR